MYCVVYRLFDGHGNRLANEVARTNGKHGWLVYRLKRPETGEPFNHAVLLPKEGAPEDPAVLPMLRHAKIRPLHGGLRLTGQEFDVNHRYLKQAWWVVPASD